MFTFFRKNKKEVTLSEISTMLDLKLPIALVFTPTNLESEKKKFFESDSYNPVFEYKLVKNDNYAKLSKLASVSKVVDVDPRISDFYLSLIDDKAQANDLMHAVGNNENLTELSNKRFRRPSDKLFRNATRIGRGRVKKYKLLDSQKVFDSELLDYERIKSAMEITLSEIGLTGWSVEKSQKIMKNGVKVGIKRKEIRMDPNIKKRSLNLRKTIVHEIGTHVLRAHNGLKTGIDALGKPNLVGYQDIEEGLAMYNEEKMGVLDFVQFRKRALLSWAIFVGEEMSFRHLYNSLLMVVPKLGAFDIAYRVKRGLHDTAQPGIYGKDIVYFRGFRIVRKRLESDMSLYNKLYAGKIGFKQISWVDDGLIPKAEIVLDPNLFERAFKKAGI